MVGFMQFFLNLQGYAKEGKKCQEWMEEIEESVEDIDMFQKNHPDDLKTIHEMFFQEKEF